MPAIISTFEMRCAEAAAIEAGVPQRELMLNAGRNAAMEIVRFCNATLQPRHRQRYFVLAGGGNNGGDAFVVAHNLDKPAVVFTTAETHADPAAEFRQGLDFVDEFKPQAGDVIIDGLLGIGIHGAVRPEMAALIEKVNASGLPVVSLDLPSGLNADDGSGECVVNADMTVTMHSPKQGMFVGKGPDCCGVIRVVSIGIPNEFEIGEHPLAFGEDEARALLPRRKQTSHKYDFGHLLCLAGSENYPGAPALAARSAARGGVGLVTLAVPGGTKLPYLEAALIVRHLGDDAHFTHEHLETLPLEKYNAILFGPGIGQDVPSQVLETLLAADIPMVIDADGLRLLAKLGAKAAVLLLKRKQPVVLTPHEGELNALRQGVPGILKMPPSCLYIVRKGPQTKVHSPDGTFSVNLSGNAALATAGTGDVLAGLVASFLAQGMAAQDATRLAVFLHGHAASISTMPQRALMADDLLALLPRALADISPLS